MKILQSEITGTQTSFPTNKEEIREWSIKPPMSAPSANTRQFGWTSLPNQTPLPPQDQQRTYVKKQHWPNIYFVFANLSWARQDGKYLTDLQSFSQDVPSNWSQCYPRGGRTAPEAILLFWGTRNLDHCPSTK